MDKIKSVKCVQKIGKWKYLTITHRYLKRIWQLMVYVAFIMLNYKTSLRNRKKFPFFSVSLGSWKNLRNHSNHKVESLHKSAEGKSKGLAPGCLILVYSVSKFISMENTLSPFDTGILLSLAASPSASLVGIWKRINQKELKYSNDYLT